MKQIKYGMTTAQMNDWKIAYNEGFDAKQRGLLYRSNPYTPGTVSYDGWQRGWTTASIALLTKDWK